MLVHNACFSALFIRTVMFGGKEESRKEKTSTVARKYYYPHRKCSKTTYQKVFSLPTTTHNPAKCLNKITHVPLHNRTTNVKEILPGSKES